MPRAEERGFHGGKISSTDGLPHAAETLQYRMSEIGFGGSG